jgi:phosphate:Na+ symporter
MSVQIDANLGTTSTAAVAVVKTTAAAKRLALAHIVFNVITGIVALALLPAVLWAVGLVADWLGVEGSPAAVLALTNTGSGR